MDSNKEVDIPSQNEAPESLEDFLDRVTPRVINERLPIHPSLGKVMAIMDLTRLPPDHDSPADIGKMID